tara:strand:- start:46 stop:507 length:462 start_codon:yes stop_codon:yes gene_type:complete
MCTESGTQKQAGKNVTSFAKSGWMQTIFLLILLMCLIWPSKVTATYVIINSKIDLKIDLYKDFIYGNKDGLHSLGYGYQDKNFILMGGMQEVEDKTPEWYLEFYWKHPFPYGINAGLYVCQTTELNLDYNLTEKLAINLKVKKSPELGMKYLF